MCSQSGYRAIERKRRPERKKETSRECRAVEVIRTSEGLRGLEDHLIAKERFFSLEPFLDVFLSEKLCLLELNTV